MAKSVIVLAFLACIQIGSPFSYDFSVLLKPKVFECFYQPILRKGVEIEFEYVIYSKKAIKFTVSAPNGDNLITNENFYRNVVKITSESVGTYKVCLQNFYFNHEISGYLALYSEEHDKTWPFSLQQSNEDYFKEQVEQIMEVSVQEIKAAFGNLTMHLDKMRYLQQSIRVSNFKDFVVARGNLERVNWFSAIQSLIMVATGVTQVVVIRKLFSSQHSGNMKAVT